MKTVLLCLALTVMSAGGSWAGDPLAGSEWGPGYPEKQSVRFAADGEVFGTGGCNRFFGAYEASPEGTINIGPLASTKMACPDDVMQKEDAFLRMLEAAAGFTRETGEMRLFDKDKEEIALLRHLDWD